MLNSADIVRLEYYQTDGNKFICRCDCNLTIRYLDSVSTSWTFGNVHNANQKA